MTYLVKVVTDYVFTVEANSVEEAEKEAVAQAELKHGNWYDWEIEDVEKED